MTEVDKELAEIKTDIRWMKKEFEKSSKKMDKIDDLHNVFTKGDGKIHALNKCVYGNGEEGLVKRTKALECFMNKVKGAIDAGKFVLGIGIVNLIGLLIMLVKLYKSGLF